MPIVSQSYTHVVGVDTHARTHTLAVVTASGAVIADGKFPATAAGMKRAMTWVMSRTLSTTQTLVSAEGTWSYGAQLCGVFQSQGYRVVEAPTPIRGHGTHKSDKTDAISAARAVLPLTVKQLRDRRSDGARAQLQALVSLRELLTTQRTMIVNALTALLRTHDLGIDARHKLSAATITHISGWTPNPDQLFHQIAVTHALQIKHYDLRLTTNTTHIHTLVTTLAPQLLDLTGVGPITAAAAIVAWSHSGRVRNEAAYASLAGVSPLQASSGNTNRHRLNRGGDRRLNKAIHTITITRQRCDTATRTYTERRKTEGLTNKEITRCLKRYIARKLYRTLNHTT